MRVERGEAVRKKLQQLRTSSRQVNNVSVIVGYTAAYALYVHEAPMTLKGEPRTVWFTKNGKRYRTNIALKGRYWDPQGKASNKFLERPYRENYKLLVKTVEKYYQRNLGLRAGLIAAGLFLQRLSQQMCPVNTGNLKASAFTREEQQ